jgi:hypothetical protein
MIITICSDIHDNIWKLAAALPGMREGEVLLFCGDFCAPFSLAQLAAGFPGHIHAVLGNNDGDARLLSEEARTAGNVTLHGHLAEIELAGLKVAVNHYPEIADALAASGRYDLVCHGHDHTVRSVKTTGAWLVDPGELMGRFGRSTYVLFDTVMLAAVVREV